MTALTPVTKFDLMDLLPTVRDSVVSPQTKRAYMHALAAFIEWNGGQELDRARVLQYRQHLLDLGKAPSTIRLHLSAIRKLAREAEAQGCLIERTARLICAVEGVPRKGRRLGNWLTAEQVYEVLTLPDQSTAKGLRDFVLLGLLLGCGLRRAEIVGIRAQQVVYRDGRMVVVDLVGKGQRIRTAVIPRWLEEPLKKWLGSIPVAPGDYGMLIRRVNQRGEIQMEGMIDERVAQIVVRYAQGIGVKCSAHDLRRTFALQSLKGGANVEAIRQALGHASLATTTRYVASADALRNPACDFVLGGK